VLLDPADLAALEAAMPPGTANGERYPPERLARIDR
jgi:hypothetical protein